MAMSSSPPIHAVVAPVPRRRSLWRAANPTAWLFVLPAAIAYVLWNYALSRMPASLLSSFLYLSPVIASFIAWVWLGEIPALLTILGGAIAILGVILVQTKGHRAT